MLDPVVNFFTRIFEAIGRGIGLAVSFVLSPFRWLGSWFARRGGILKAVLGAILVLIVALYLYFFWNTQVWTGFDPDYAARYSAPPQRASTGEMTGQPAGIVSTTEQAGGAATGGARAARPLVEPRRPRLPKPAGAPSSSRRPPTSSISTSTGMPGSPR